VAQNMTPNDQIERGKPPTTPPRVRTDAKSATTGEYGEPWRAEINHDAECWDIKRNDGHRLGKITIGYEALRVPACVNALSGLNPAALAGLIEAATKACEDCDHDCSKTNRACVFGNLRAALAALKGEAHE
jgi:hypothetical protein